jgi:1-acyl-sn-glycerol-3-phosphate acyltransferase
MRLNHIELRRGDRERGAMMKACSVRSRRQLDAMFPEGTRSPDGRLRAFKPGAFSIALATKSPLLPIVLEGTGNTLPKRGFVLRGRHPIRIRVLDEIPYDSFATKSVEQLTIDVRNLFAKELGEAELTP